MPVPCVLPRVLGVNTNGRIQLHVEFWYDLLAVLHRYIFILFCCVLVVLIFQICNSEFGTLFSYGDIVSPPI